MKIGSTNTSVIVWSVSDEANENRAGPPTLVCFASLAVTVMNGLHFILR
jgi:hypothetical protein